MGRICCNIVFGVGLWLWPNEMYAQIRENPESLGTSRQDSVPDGIMPLDTPVAMSFIRLDHATLQYQTDSLGWDDMRHDPLPFTDAHLGNRGSATRSLIANQYNPIGYDHGLFQYHRYFYQDTTQRFYNQSIPVVLARYSQASQENTHLNLDFGRRFASGVNLSFQYNRINQVGEFTNQHQRNTSFAVGVYHDAPNQRYDAFYSLVSNAAITQENGGVQSIADVTSGQFSDIRIPVWLTTGVSSQKYRSFVTKQIFHLVRDSASLGIDIWMKAAYRTALYKYVDEEGALDTLYYDPIWRNDARGIRQYTHNRILEGTVGLALPWTKANSTVSAGLRYRSIKLNQEPEQRIRNELYLDGEADFHWIEPLKLNGLLSLGLGDANGNFAFEANGILTLGVVGALQGRWAITSRKPYGVESKLYINQQLVYATDFDNPLRNDVQVQFNNERFLLKAGIRWSVFDNYIYFDSMALPMQVNGSVSLQQFFVEKEFDFRWIGIILKGWWQPDAPAILALPGSLAEVSLYGRLNMFKRKLAVVPGIDITYIDKYDAVSYFPVNGVYHLQAGQQIPAYTRIDAGIGIRVKFLKVFLRMEDVIGLFDDEALYQAALYPHYSQYLRIGVTAGFFN
jgi:hypothetical protein